MPQYERVELMNPKGRHGFRNIETRQFLKTPDGTVIETRDFQKAMDVVKLLNQGDPESLEAAKWMLKQDLGASNAPVTTEITPARAAEEEKAKGMLQSLKEKGEEPENPTGPRMDSVRDSRMPATKSTLPTYSKPSAPWSKTPNSVAPSGKPMAPKPKYNFTMKDLKAPNTSFEAAERMLTDIRKVNNEQGYEAAKALLDKLNNPVEAPKTPTVAFKKLASGYNSISFPGRIFVANDLASMLDEQARKKDQGDWQVSQSEPEWQRTRLGKEYQCVWQPSTGRRGFLGKDDIIYFDQELTQIMPTYK